MKYRYDIDKGLTKIKTKLTIAITAMGLVMASSGMSFAIISSANASTPPVPGPWQITALSTINFSCGGGTYVHTLDTVTQGSGGNFTGTGHYNPDPSYTWNAVGNVTGNNLAFNITYTGTAAGTVYNSTGTIAPDGSVSGTTDSNCQSFTMPAGSAVQISLTKDSCKNDGWKTIHDTNGKSFKNQGDCVSYIATGGKNLAAGN